MKYLSKITFISTNIHLKQGVKEEIFISIALKYLPFLNSSSSCSGWWKKISKDKTDDEIIIMMMIIIIIIIFNEGVQLAKANRINVGFNHASCIKPFASWSKCKWEQFTSMTHWRSVEIHNYKQETLKAYLIRSRFWISCKAVKVIWSHGLRRKKQVLVTKTQGFDKRLSHLRN